MSDPRNTPPAPEAAVNPIPPAVLALVAVLMGIELILWAGERGIVGGAAAAGWRGNAWQDFGFAPRLWAFMWQTGDWTLNGLFRLLSYAFVSIGFVQTVFACVFVLAFGKFVGDVMGGARAVIIYLAATVGAAVAYGSIFPEQVLLIGAFPGAYGLLGGYTYILLVAAEATNQNRLQSFKLIGMLAALQLVFGVIFGGPPYWLADLSGAVIGFIAAMAMGPGGLLRYIRRR